MGINKYSRSRFSENGAVADALFKRWPGGSAFSILEWHPRCLHIKLVR